MEYNKKSLANKAIVSFINGKQQKLKKKYRSITNKRECEQNILMSALIFSAPLRFVVVAVFLWPIQHRKILNFLWQKLWVLEMILF